MSDLWATKRHYFKTEAEMAAFIEGVAWVNDSAIELDGSGIDPVSEHPTHPWLAIYSDEDYGPEENADFIHPEETLT